MEIQHLWDSDHGCARPPGSTPRLPPETVWPARGSGRAAEPRAQWVRRGGRAPSRGSARARRSARTPPAGPLGTHAGPLRPGGSAFSPLPPSPPGRPSARARAPLAAEVVATKLGPRRARECGARRGGGLRAVGRGGAQEPTSASRADRDGPLTASSLPSPPALAPVAPSTLRDQAPAWRRESASRSPLPEARGALLRAPRVSLPLPGGRRSGALGGHRYHPFPETSRS